MFQMPPLADLMPLVGAELIQVGLGPFDRCAVFDHSKRSKACYECLERLSSRSEAVTFGDLSREMSYNNSASVVVTKDWLHARGHLHDARVRALRDDNGRVALVINDEWSNEHDSEHETSPGELWLDHPVAVVGDLRTLEFGWISEIEFEPDGTLRIDSDQGRIVVCVDDVYFVPQTKAER